MDRALLLVVCGLRAEADIAAGRGDRDPRVVVIAGGGDSRRLAADIADHAPRARAIVSFGVAGGLEPGIAAGDLRVATAVVAPGGERYPTDPNWSAALAARLGARTATFAAVDAPLADVAGKAALHRATGAATVDMESHLAARAAAAHGLAFAGLRVVTDGADRALPHAATVGMRADGSVDGPAIAMSLARNPTQLPALIRTGLDARRAFATLLRCRQLLGPGFAFFDL